MEKLNKRYLELFKAFTKSDKLCGVSSPFLSLHPEDKIYYSILQIINLDLKTSYNSSEIYKCKVIENKKKMKRQCLKLDFPIIPENSENKVAKQTKKSLNDVIAEFFIINSKIYSENFYIIIVTILKELRNCYDILGWKFLISSSIEITKLASEIEDSLDPLFKILNFFISDFCSIKLSKIDYALIIIVVNYFCDWLLFKKYTKNRLNLN